MILVDKFLHLQSSLTNLNNQEDFLELSIDLKVRRILKTCSYLLKTPRISLWIFSEDRQSIVCQSLYYQIENKFESGLVIAEPDCPNYFRALNSNRVISANDAQNDNRTNEFLDGYLKPLDIKSMLDAPIFSNGQLTGVLCIEQTRQCRDWDMAEISYAASTADAISLLYAQDKWFTERKELLFMEQIDPLTNLENRLFFQKRINQATKSVIGDHDCGVILLGLDGFTGINDRFGHDFANNVLCQVARYLDSIDRFYSTYSSRIGGDVFALWLPNNSDQLSTLVSKLANEFPLEIKAPENEIIQISASIGILVCKLKRLLDFDPIRKAEIAMLEAKQSRTNICFYDFEWDKKLQESIKLESEFISALNNSQIKPYYQPIIGKNYQCDGFSLEALVRWEHPIKGVLSPFIFLPIAKRLGLMKEVGDIVLEQACHDIRMFLDKGLNLHRISVNISTEQLFSPGLIELVERLVKKYQIDFSSLEFEIVEELIAEDSQVLMSQLDALTKLGIALSIDDFGTGYSSLSRLKNLKVSKLKIDKSFVDGLPDDEDDVCIAKSIIGLAKGMDLNLVAEGVETKEQAQWLLKHDCDLLQGYLFSKPIKSSLIEDFIRAKSNFPDN